MRSTCLSDVFIRTTRYVPYYCISTTRQGQSGHGLEAQQAAERAFVTGPANCLTEFVEVESGKKNKRPQLAGELNGLGFTAPRGGTFNQKQVQRLYERLVGEPTETSAINTT